MANILASGDTVSGLVFMSCLGMEKESEARSNLRGKKPRTLVLSRWDKWDEGHTRAIFVLIESLHFFSNDLPNSFY